MKMVNHFMHVQSLLLQLFYQV